VIADCRIKKNVDSPPSDLHLCQPDSQKSCGWCCGLYNTHHASRNELVRKLRARSKEFATTERNLAAIQRFSEKTIRNESPRLLDAEFYSCEFVGFLNSGETRVGCMLHPLAQGNQSIDWRGLSFHGAMACQGFFCRSYRELNSTEKWVILGTIHDWYLYGMVISDTDYARTFFRLLEERVGAQIDPVNLVTPPASGLVHEFFHWKIDWPYRHHDPNPARCSSSPFSRVDPDFDGQESSAALDMMFACLGSRFRSRVEHTSAQQRVDQLFSRLSMLV
jgi:hypothetical protein